MYGILKQEGIVNEQEIFEVIMRCSNEPNDGDAADLLIAFVQQLAHLSTRLSKSELIALTAIGVGLYQIAATEMHAKSDAEDALRRIRDKGKEK